MKRQNNTLFIEHCVWLILTLNVFTFFNNLFIITDNQNFIYYETIKEKTGTPNILPILDILLLIYQISLLTN